MRKYIRIFLPLLLASLLLLAGCTDSGASGSAPTPTSAVSSEVQVNSADSSLSADQSSLSPGTDNKPTSEKLPEDGEYTSKDDVARYLYLYAHLPGNFITKKEARTLGWESSKGNLGEVAPGKSIGGDYFGNYEGNLPEKPGREYHECDIDSTGGYRGAKRIVYSTDGLIYYTEDHYQNFELLYGEE